MYLGESRTTVCVLYSSCVRVCVCLWRRQQTDSGWEVEVVNDWLCELKLK